MTVLERFLNYVKIETTSDEESECCPTSEKEWVLARLLEKELKELGAENVRVSENAYVYGEIPATPGKESEPVIGLIAHMDTSPDASGKEVCPEIIEYKGGDIALKGGKVTSLSVFPFLKNYIGKHLVITDGNTLLGADDKAGVAEIMTCAEALLQNKVPHGKVVIGFTPDEEVGKGADLFDIPGFGADFAYTVDGGTLGEMEYENFNASSVKVTFHGVNIHPGYAKDKMKNACLMMADFVALLPPKEIPARTEGRQGFFHVNRMECNETVGVLHLILRDHDKKKFASRKVLLEKAVAKINAKYGEGCAELEIADSYYNMIEKITPVMHIVERMKKAYLKAGVTPMDVPVRGGTDGARLSYEGLPCPNICTGSENFHSVYEFAAVEDMEKVVEILLNLVEA